MLSTAQTLVKGAEPVLSTTDKLTVLNADLSSDVGTTELLQLEDDMPVVGEDVLTVEEIVKTAIKTAPEGNMIFAKSYCPYCAKAKELLKSKGIPFNAMELDQRKDGDMIQKYLYTLTGQTTVPNVFLGYRHVGGYSDLALIYN